MVQINFAKREVQCKLVYYGPGMSGKTTNLEQIHKLAPQGMRGDMTTIATDEDRTLFFDFMPLDLGTIAGLRTKFQMYTVPGQVYYDSVRKLVLDGSDGVAFVADSGPDRMADNIESLKNLDENLRAYGYSLESLPWVIQYNKRDLPGAIPIEELQAKLNPHGVPWFEGIAFKGEGVMKTLKGLSELVIARLNKEYGRGGTGASTTKPPAPPPPVRRSPEGEGGKPRPAVSRSAGSRLPEPVEGSEPAEGGRVERPPAAVEPKRVETPAVAATATAPPPPPPPVPRSPEGVGGKPVVPPQPPPPVPRSPEGVGGKPPAPAPLVPRSPQGEGGKTETPAKKAGCGASALLLIGGAVAAAAALWAR